MPLSVINVKMGFYMQLILEMILDFFSNGILLVALISWFTSQVLKLIINAVVNKDISFERLIGDGGMPSGHSATVCSTAALCAWCYGFDSVVFGIAFVVALIVMHDASGVRRETGKHATVIKDIAEVINESEEISAGGEKEVDADMLKELVGHTPLQVLAGAVVGVLITFLFCLITGVGYASGVSATF